MSERLMRGYAIRQTIEQIERAYDAATRARIYETIPEEIQSAFPTLAPTAWYPWEYQAALYRGIGSLKSDEAAVYQELVTCGEMVASEATNTFLRFLMKILTPSIFAKKVPQFWARDNRGGVFSVDVSEAEEGRIRMTLSGVGGYDHCAPPTVGFLSYGIRATGKDAEVTQTGWSLEQTAPEKIDFLITWRG